MSALTDRDQNVQPTLVTAQSQKQEAAGEENKAQNAAKGILEKKGGDDGSDGKPYISPSDAIMSPASQKLAGFKQRQINKQQGSDSTRRSLFAKNMSGNGERSLGGVVEEKR